MREQAIVAPQEEVLNVLPEPLSPPLLPTVYPPIGFSNGLAVRVALGSGFLAFLLSMVSGQLAPQAFSLFWVAGAGFWSVFVYSRRTGERLSVMSGARLGWICGIFLFVITTLLVTAMAVALSDPAMVTAVREQMKMAPGKENEVNQMIEMFRSPTGIALALTGTFLMFSILPACGGALGAKILGRSHDEA